MAAAKESVDANREIVEGIPYQAILEYTDSHQVDLIVLGRSGKGRLDQLVLGRVTDRLLRTAPVPVLIV